MSLYWFFAKALKWSDFSDPSGPLSVWIAIKEGRQVMLALPYTAHKCERYQLRMHTISRSKHTKLRNMKSYSKGILVNHTKISTNENFLLREKRFADL